jgi:hypothetical protein
MAKTRFTPAPRGAPVFFNCPTCRNIPVSIASFDLAPVPTEEEGQWTSAWFLIVKGTCPGCGFTHSRAVGRFTAHTTGPLARDEDDDEDGNSTPIAS